MLTLPLVNSGQRGSARILCSVSTANREGFKSIGLHLNLLLHFFPLVFRFVTLADYSSLEFWNGQRRSGGKLGTTLKIVDGRGETVGWFIEARTQTLLLRGWC